MWALDAASLLGRKRTWAWLLVHEGVTLALCILPALRRLAGTPGFELALVQTALVVFSAGHLGTMAAGRARECGPSSSRAGLVGRAFLAAYVVALLCLALPFVTALVASVWNGQCNLATGAAFYGLLPIVSAALAASVGVLFGLALPRRFLPPAAFLAVALGSLAFTLYRLMSEAPIFCYDPFFGYFAGAIYDELVTVQPPLLWARLEAGLLAGGVLLLAAAFADPVRGRLRLGARGAAPLAAALLLFGGVTLLRVHGAALGYFISSDDIAETLGGRHETEHFVIHYPRTSTLAERIAEIAEEHEFRYEQLQRFFETEPAGKVHSFLYRDPSQKARLMGARRVSIAKPWIREMHLHDMGFPHPVLRHELAHVFGGRFGSWFGVSAKSPISYNVGLIEGLAVAADWSLGALTGHEWARAVLELRKEKAPRVEQLLGVTGFWGESSSLAYTLCGSFVRYLAETHGIARVRDVYGDGDFERVFSVPLATLARAWRESLADVPVGPRELAQARRHFRDPSIFRRTCPHEMARLAEEAARAQAAKDHDREVALRREALRYQPKNPVWRKRLVEALLRAKRVDEAAMLVARPQGGKENVELIELRADLFWRMERLAEARNEYVQLSRRHPPPDVVRRAAIKIAAVDDPRAGPRVRRFLVEEEGSVSLRLLELRELIAEVPSFAPGHYLLGRQLFFARRYAEAAKLLAQAARLGLPGVELTLENRRLLAIATFQLGDHAGALEHFRDLAEGSFPRAVGLEARDWIERCNFARRRRRVAAAQP